MKAESCRRWNKLTSNRKKRRRREPVLAKYFEKWNHVNSIHELRWYWLWEAKTGKSRALSALGERIERCGEGYREAQRPFVSKRGGMTACHVGICLFGQMNEILVARPYYLRGKYNIEKVENSLKWASSMHSFGDSASRIYKSERKRKILYNNVFQQRAAESVDGK